MGRFLQSSAGQGTRDIAAAAPWKGTESLHDSALRMLDSSRKPIKTPYKVPQPQQLAPVDLRLTPKGKQSAGARLASARDRTSTYTLSQGPGVSEAERESLRKEMQDRYSPGARSIPMTIQGLSSLANERIEDAMARGQFKRIPRGKGVNVDTDHNANSAFIDTTEYFMNKIIQKQEIVPPWIEKQQELAREVDRFRQRLRSDWRRHAARLIASQGGSLEDQMQRARGYAAAEARLQVQAETEAALRKDVSADKTVSQLDSDGRIVAKRSVPDTPHPPSRAEEQDIAEKPLPHLPPLRDPAYLSIERSYHELAVKNLNALARTYNLQAPPIAQKPYLSLDRELSACYAEVAPTLAEEIRRRATEKSHGSRTTAQPQSSNVLDSLTMTQTSRVYDEDKSKGYGLKEFWRDLFSRKNDRQET